MRRLIHRRNVNLTGNCRQTHFALTKYLCLEVPTDDHMYTDADTKTGISTEKDADLGVDAGADGG